MVEPSAAHEAVGCRSRSDGDRKSKLDQSQLRTGGWRIRSTDQVIAYAAYQNQKATLLRYGVKLFEFSGPKNLHAKGLVIDDQVAMLGSYNFDARSERLNLELCVATHCPTVAESIKQSVLGRKRFAQRVDQHRQADVHGKATTHKKIHLRSSQLLAPLLRPLL